MDWDYPTTITSGDPPDAAPMQRNMDYARRKLNAITDDEVTGLTEGGTPARLNFDPVAGHTHNGTDSALIASAVNATPIIQGAVTVATVQIDVPAISFSTDIVVGTGITRVMGVFVGRYDFLGTNEPIWVNSLMVSNDINDDYYSIILEPAAGADEVYIWNALASAGGGTSSGVDVTFYVVLVGI